MAVSILSTNGEINKLQLYTCNNRYTHARVSGVQKLLCATQVARTRSASGMNSAGGRTCPKATFDFFKQGNTLLAIGGTIPFARSHNSAPFGDNPFFHVNTTSRRNGTNKDIYVFNRAAWLVDTVLLFVDKLKVFGERYGPIVTVEICGMVIREVYIERVTVIWIGRWEGGVGVSVGEKVFVGKSWHCRRELIC